MKNKKILLISHEFPPFGGGAGVVAYQYCLKLVEDGYNVTLLTRYQKIFPKELNNIEIITVRHIPKFWFIPYSFILKKLNLKEFDTIILNDIAAGYIAGKYFDNDILKKCVTILHGSEPENIYNQQSLWFKLIKFNKYYDFMIKNCKKIIAVSNYMKEKFLEETTFKDDKKIEVVYAGLDKIFKQNIEVNCKNIYNYENKEIILTVSRIEKDKGFLEMYEVFKKLIKKDKDFIWMIIGDGSFKNEFEEIVRKDGMQNNIIFKGKIDRNELPRYYKCADVFWLISKYKESFGLVYLESQSCGTPAIGLNRYGVKEAIKHNETGFLVENVEDSLEIFLDRKYKKIDKEKCIDFSNTFQWTFYA
jgi:glycosyltransferase involved in cell wall biosynthesis